MIPDGNLDLNNLSKTSRGCNLGIDTSCAPQLASMKETILEGFTENLINACLFSLDFVEKDIPIFVDPLKYLITYFIAAKCEGVALCRYAHKMLVIVAISDLFLSIVTLVNLLHWG